VRLPRRVPRLHELHSIPVPSAALPGTHNLILFGNAYFIPIIGNRLHQRRFRRDISPTVRGWRRRYPATSDGSAVHIPHLSSGRRRVATNCSMILSRLVGKMRANALAYNLI
jgi:hypothetical protein